MVTTLSSVRLQHGKQVNRRLKLEEHIQRKTSPSAKFNSQLKVCFKNFKKTPSHKILYHFFLSHRRACKRQHANKKCTVATSNAVKDTMLLNANTVQYRFYYTCILL